MTEVAHLLTTQPTIWSFILENSYHGELLDTTDNSLSYLV